MTLSWQSGKASALSKPSLSCQKNINAIITLISDSNHACFHVSAHRNVDKITFLFPTLFFSCRINKKRFELDSSTCFSYYFVKMVTMNEMFT